MKNLLLATVALAAVGMATQASAADLAARPYTKAPAMAPGINWSGFYVGVMGGYAWNNVLWYVKGGAAVTNDKYEGLTVGSTVFDRASETRWGGTVGTGLEYGFAPNWSAAIEYDHLFMGTRNVSFTSVLPPAGLNSRNDSIRQDVDMVTARINYRWGGPVISKY